MYAKMSLAVAMGVILCPSSVSGAGASASPKVPPPQSEYNLFELMARPLPEAQPVQVVVLFRTDRISLQLVRIRTEVKPHYHGHHTETITILEGEGVFRIGEETFETHPGDVFVIPPETVHAFTVTGEVPVAALTSFSPGFDGKDRIFTREQ